VAEAFNEANLRLAYGGRVAFLSRDGVVPDGAGRAGDLAARRPRVWTTTPRTVALGAACSARYAGGLGTFAVLRRQSLLGDAISTPSPACARLPAHRQPLSPVAPPAGGLAGWLARCCSRW
jgi:hypothetical protein